LQHDDGGMQRSTGGQRDHLRRREPLHQR
jgi:hypothetical protein